MTTRYAAVGYIARPKTTPRKPAEGRRDAPTAPKWRDALLTAFAIACLALPLGIAAAGNLAGIP